LVKLLDARRIDAGFTHSDAGSTASGVLGGDRPRLRSPSSASTARLSGVAHRQHRGGGSEGRSEFIDLFLISSRVRKANWEKARHPRCRDFEPVLAGEEGSQRETEAHVIRSRQHNLGIEIDIGSHLSASLRVASDTSKGRKRPLASVLAIRFHRYQEADRATGKTSRCRTQSQGSGGRSEIAEPALEGFITHRHGLALTRQPWLAKVRSSCR
jgi:hypothetical protein